MKTRSKRLKMEADAINSERRKAQESVSNQLWQANVARYELSDKIMEIAVACAFLEDEIASMQASNE